MVAGSATLCRGRAEVGRPGLGSDEFSLVSDAARGGDDKLS